MIYYIDGFTIGSNPSNEGGYTITDQNGNILKRKFVKSSQDNTLFGSTTIPITNNYTEFLALHDCLEEFCTYQDTIITDSQNSIAWSKKINRKSKRKDLQYLSDSVKKLISNKATNIQWVARNLNLAGIANERMKL